MERLCFQLTLVQGREKDYEERHTQIWPEMADALSRCGFRNFTLFRRGRDVVGYAECHPDVPTALAAIDQEEVNERWAASFAGVLEDGSAEIDQFLEVWHLL